MWLFFEIIQQGVISIRLKTSDCMCLLFVPFAYTVHDFKQLYCVIDILCFGRTVIKVMLLLDAVYKILNFAQ